MVEILDPEAAMARALARGRELGLPGDRLSERDVALGSLGYLYTLAYYEICRLRRELGMRPLAAGFLAAPPPAAHAALGPDDLGPTVPVDDDGQILLAPVLVIREREPND